MNSVKAVTSVPKGFVRLSDKNDYAKFLLYQVTDLSKIGDYWRLNVTNQSFSTPSEFTMGDDVLVSFVLNGNRGDKGEKALDHFELDERYLTRADSHVLFSTSRSRGDGGSSSLARRFVALKSERERQSQRLPTMCWWYGILNAKNYPFRYKGCNRIKN